MPTDNPITLATSEQFMRTAWKDLAVNLENGELDSIMVQATRACESVCKRRLAPFTVIETHRAEGIDPDEYGSGLVSVPMDLAGAIGRSYAGALGASDLVRHVWLQQYAPQFQELWTPYEVTKLVIFRSVGGSQSVNVGGVVGPEPDTGHILFPVGTFLPIGSIIRVTYIGGYSTTPADLNAACLAMAGSIVLKRLDPSIGTGHDPGSLRDEAVELLDPYMRD